MPDAANTIALAGLLGTALYTDLSVGRIYNKLTVPCMILGLALNSVKSGLPGFLGSLVGMGLILLLFLALSPLVRIGGGGVKLMMAVGSLMGVQFGIRAMFFSAVVGGLLTLVVMARRRALLATMRDVAVGLCSNAAFRPPIEPSAGRARVRFRYSPAIVLGVLLAFFLKVW